MPRLPRKRVEVHRGKDGKWWHTAFAGNSRIDGASEQGVKQRQYAVVKAIKQYPDRPCFLIDDDGKTHKVVFEITPVR